MIAGSFKVTRTQPFGKELQEKQRSSEDTVTENSLSVKKPV